MAKTTPSTPEKIYQLKITLEDTKPPIWRRVLVPGSFDMGDLHAVIQASMGWTNSHLHQFILGDRRNPVSVSDLDFELENYVRDAAAAKESLAALGFDVVLLPTLDLAGAQVLDETALTLQQVVSREKARFSYEYDFGDSWEHEILVEKIVAAEAGVEYPRCVDGKRAGPPEDCGGAWGYTDMLEALGDPKRDDHEEVLEWVGEDFDPEYLDVDMINENLQDLDEYLMPLDDDDQDYPFDDEDDEEISEEELDEAIQMINQQVRALVQEVVPSADGFAMRFPGGIPLVNAVVPQFVSVTHALNTSLKMVLEIGPLMEPVWLRITGPAEACQAVKKALGIK